MLRITLAYVTGLTALVLLVDSGMLREAALWVNGVPLLDKAIHFVMFGVLALLANATLLRQRRWSAAGAIATGSLLVVIVSTAEEWSNGLVACRTWSLADLAANYLGVLCVGILPLLTWPGRAASGDPAG